MISLMTASDKWREKYEILEEYAMSGCKSDGLEKLAAAMEEPGIRVVSFDVFDTLLVRPVAGEDDKFRLLDAKFGELSDAQISFGKLRTLAERTLRRRILRGENPFREDSPFRRDFSSRKESGTTEDVTLEEIYSVLQDDFLLPPDVAGIMLREEYRLEKRLCRARESGRYLFEKAGRAGYRIIVTSDMYLSAEQIGELLSENGYGGMEKIFVSSEYRKMKRTGSLYRVIPEVLGVKPCEILHIGDDREADVRMAEESGLRALWLPKTREVFQAHGCSVQAEKICTDLTNWETAEREPGIAAMRQMAANRYFDDPFRSFLSDSDYNADPFFVGYAALGMEILAVVKWLAESCERDGIENLLFLSRDGYLPMKAWELYRQAHPELPEGRYMYASRIAVLPMMIRQPADLYDLPTDISRQTPEKLLRLLEFCSTESSRRRLMDEMPAYREEADLPFTEERFLQFISDFIHLAYDSSAHQKSRDRVKTYVKRFAGSRTAFFDMGYSGRTAGAIAEAAGTPIGVYYFHADGGRQFRAEKKSGFRIRSFFDFSPYMESTMREYAYLEPAPSCVGYTDRAEPVFDCGPAEGYTETASEMQRGALEMVRDYLSFFAGYEAEAGFRCHNAAMPFEAFLRYAAPADRQIYGGVVIDDELWGGRRDIRLRDLMEARLRKLPAYAADSGKNR